MDTGLCKRLLFSHHDDGSKDTVGISPLHLAAKNGHNDVIRLYISNSKGTLHRGSIILKL